MAVYSTRSRITGLGGLDTETMINQLMRAETLKLNKLQKNSTKLTWKQEAYWTAAESLKNFDTKFLNTLSSNSIRLAGTFNKYNSTVKKSNGDVTNAVKVIAGGSSAGGTYKLSVTQLATKDTYSTEADPDDGTALVKGSIGSKGEITQEAINDIKADGGSFTMTLDGVSKSITISPSDFDGISSPDANDLAGIIQGKVDAAFGKNADNSSKIVIGTNDKGGLSMTPAGNGHTLKIYEGGAVQQKSTASGAPSDIDDLKALLKDHDNKYTINFKSGERSAAVEFDFSGWDDDAFEEADLDKILSEMNRQMSAKGVSAQFEKGDDGKVSAKTTSLSRDKLEMADDEAGGLMSQLGFSTDVTLKSTSTLGKLDIANGDSNHLGADDKLSDVFSAIWPMDGAELAESYEMTINDKTITLNKNDSIEDLKAKIKSSGAGVSFTYNELKQTFTLQADKEGANNAIKMDAAASDLFAELGLVKSQDAKDAQIILNDVATTRESNTFTHNGVTFVLNEEVDNLTVEVTKDTSNTKQILTDFVNAYNGLIEGLNGLVGEVRAKNNGKYYEPLTDEEKKAMSEDEIKKWETTAKQGILSRDPILSGITSAMRSQLYQSVTLEDGSKLALYQIGITTSDDYKDQGKLVIDEKALEAAIEKYGDKITEMFTRSADSTLTGAAKQATTSLGDRMSKIVNDAIDTAKGSISVKAGAKTGYTSKVNDLLTQINAESKKISDMLTYLANREDYYYSMFAKLEAAMSQNDSQMAYLSQMFGV